MARRIVVNVSAALLAVGAVLMPPGESRAGNACTASDLLNGLESAIGTIASGSCTSVCSDAYACAAAVAVSVGLAGASAESGQAAINQVCSAVQNVSKTATSGSDDANTVLGLVKQYAPSLSSDLQDQIASALSSVVAPIGVAMCGCSIEQGLGQLTSDLGACIQDVLCAGDKLLGDPCTCTAPPPIVANCAQSNDLCGEAANPNPACQGINTIFSGPNGQNVPGYETVNQVVGPSGTFVSTGGGSSDGNGHCSPVTFCFCPAPMVPTWTPAISSPGFSIFSCNCPSGTHPGGTAGGVSVCLCDGTNQPANFAPDVFGGMCAAPSCSNGQIMIGNQCVTPCSNPTEGMTADGACCDPSQVTSCGTCCPPGEFPDPSTGSCIKPQVPQ